MRRSVTVEGYGIPMDEWSARRGVKMAPNQESTFGGVPVGSFDTFHEEVPVLSRCEAVTKSGAACKAAPVRGQQFCVGHLRQLEAADESQRDT